MLDHDSDEERDNFYSGKSTGQSTNKTPKKTKKTFTNLNQRFLSPNKFNLSSKAPQSQETFELPLKLETKKKCLSNRLPVTKIASNPVDD